MFCMEYTIFNAWCVCFKLGLDTLNIQEVNMFFRVFQNELLNRHKLKINVNEVAGNSQHLDRYFNRFTKRKRFPIQQFFCVCLLVISELFRNFFLFCWKGDWGVLISVPIYICRKYSTSKGVTFRDGSEVYHLFINRLKKKQFMGTYLYIILMKTKNIVTQSLSGNGNNKHNIIMIYIYEK